jgi:hypothetical protein
MAGGGSPLVCTYISIAFSAEALQYMNLMVCTHITSTDLFVTVLLMLFLMLLLLLVAAVAAD